MLKFTDKESQISPCIASKARYALGYKDFPNNKGECTSKYWERVIDTFGKNNNLNEIQIKNAKGMYGQIFNR